MRVLHLSPHPDALSGIAAYGERYRAALNRAGSPTDALLSPPVADPSRSAVAEHAGRAAQLATDYDLVHAELGGRLVFEFWSARRTAALGVPLALTLHDPPGLTWGPYAFGAASSRRALRMLTRVATIGVAARVEAALVRDAACVFTLSELGAQRVVERFGVQRGKVAVLPFPARGGRAGTAPPREEFVAGFFGHWYGGKGMDLLIDAIESTAHDPVPVRARIWGSDWPYGGAAAARYRRRILARVAASRARDLIELAGHLPEHLVPTALGGCDVLVFPYESTRASSSLASTSGALHDALAAGTPVVVSDARALSEAVRIGETGLVVPRGDRRALTAALRRLRDDDGVRRHLRRGAARAGQARPPSLTAARALASYAQAIVPALPRQESGAA